MLVWYVRLGWFGLVGGDDVFCVCVTVKQRESCVSRGLFVLWKLSIVLTLSFGSLSCLFVVVGLLWQAIHPTAGEELVTMGVWGTSPQHSGAKVSPLLGAPAGEPTLHSKI